MPLFLDGRHETYVESEALVRAGDAFLLAGTPSYVLRRGRDGGAVALVRDSVVGVILGPDDEVRGVSRPPIDGLLIEWRAVELGERAWGVTFTELLRPAGRTAGAYVDGHLWTGTLRAGRWESIARVPLPVGWRLLPSSASTLVRRGDTLAVAVSMDSAAIARRTVVFERRHGRWSHRMLPFAAVYVDLAYQDGLGFAAAIVRADSSVTPGHNKLYLYVPDPPNAELRAVDTSGTHAVHQPILAGDSGALVLTWWHVSYGPQGARFPAYAVIDPLTSPPGPAQVLDPDVESIIHMTAPNKANLWLADHILADASRELRLLATSNGSVRTLWRAPDPFDGLFRAAPLTGRRLLIVGPSFDRSRGVLTSLMLMLELECEPPSW